MNNIQTIKENPAIQNHVNMLQSIINRMASNSANSKTWAITIISAILVLLFDKQKTCLVYIVYIPLLLFYFLDSFYLGLEKHFRGEYENFVDKIESDKFDFKEVYKINGPKKFKDRLRLMIRGLWSFSTTPFYVIFAILIYILLKIS